MRAHVAIAALLVAGCTGAAAQPPAPAIATVEKGLGAPPRFTLFESGQVRPLALAPNGKRLYAVNTPDNRLEIFDVGASGLVHRGAVVVGLEPVAVAARSNDEVWVVNHLSDSVSIVDVSQLSGARVVRTLLVGDEPRDVVFAGPGRRRAFITTAHRGQNNPADPQLSTPGVGRADVWAFDAASLGASLGGTPLAVLTLFTDTPRALAVSPDGARVYAAGFETGNRTTSLNELLIPDGGQAAGGLPAPNTNALGERQPETGLIVKFNGSNWVDKLGRIWDSAILFSLPDKDVFAIDAMASPPALVAGSAGFWSGVGTVLFNMAVNPVSGKIYVANTEARNDERFEGPGIFAGSSVRGHLHESRITVLSPGQVRPRHLNKHVDYATCCAAAPNAENARSLATPMGMAVSSNGATLYVAAFGSSKVGIFSTAQLENDTFVPSTASQVAVSGGGPSGLVLDESRGRLYVMTRFDNGISVVSTATRHEIDHVALYNPEPESVVAGRPFLYDAAFTSSHGDSSCSSCHVFGDFDGLAWDLGNPDGAMLANANPTIFNPLAPPPTDFAFKPMKGPMVTQSLRGMSNSGPMHWRGDRNGGLSGPTVQPDGGAFDENAAFMAFNQAFVGLLGRSAQLSSSEMQAFTDFILQIVYPPNPIRNLDNSLTASQQAGRDHYFTDGVDSPFFSCNSCHVLDPAGNSEYGVRFPGFFGTDGRQVFETLDPVLPQPIKVPHLRNLYQKVGMFGTPDTFIFGGQTTWQGDQVRGFGYDHDGSVDSIMSFMHNAAFGDLLSPAGFITGPAGDPARRQMVDFLMAFDSNLRPIVGQQITLRAGQAAVVGPRIDLLVARAAAGDCELVAKANVAGHEVGFLYSGGAFVSDRAALPPVSDATLRQLALATGRELTYTCVPVGSGRRIGIDADLDGYRDGDEDAAGSDPRDPADTP